MNRRVWGMLALLLCAPVAAQSPVPDARVARAQFTSAIENREPVDEILVLEGEGGKVFFFTDLRHLEGRTVTHRWEYEGRPVSEKSFQVGGPRWRVFSSKTLQPGQYGEWSVTVLDQSGWPLYTGIFRYQSASGSEDSSAATGVAAESGVPDSGDTAGTGTSPWPE